MKVRTDGEKKVKQGIESIPKLLAANQVLNGTLSDLVLSHGENNEATALPFWYIAVKGGSVQRGRNVFIAGIWFNREAAERHLENRAYAYPKNAFVYCDSGHNSLHVKRLYELARAI